MALAPDRLTKPNTAYQAPLFPVTEYQQDPLYPQPYPVSMDYGPMPRRIARQFSAGLRMNAGFSHGHPGTYNNLRLPPPIWSSPTRGSRSVHVTGRYAMSRSDSIAIPSVFVPNWQGNYPGQGQ